MPGARDPKRGPVGETPIIANLDIDYNGTDVLLCTEIADVCWRASRQDWSDIEVSAHVV